MNFRWLMGVSALLVVVVASATPAFAVGSPVKAGTATVEMFPPAQGCACHSELVDEWSVSMHAQALSDPIFNAKVAQADKATDGKIGPFCRRCHAPAADMTGEIAAGKITGPGTIQGVGCMFCHQVTGMAKGEPGNTSQLVEPDGTRRAQITDPQAPHAAAYSKLHESAEICGGCHNVNHPVNGMHLEATYSEWKASPYAAEGVVCQDCHMTRQAGQRGPSRGEAAMGAPTRDNIYHMTFVGAQVALGNAEQATAMLKSAAEIKIDAPDADVIAQGQSAPVQVTITNVGAGHYLPTGLTEVRQMWLEVTAEKPDGSTAKVGERLFGTILKDDKGNAPVELWEATGIESDDRIPPRESVTATYTVEMPQGAEELSLKAALYYKSVPDDLAADAGTENPTTEMATASRTVYASSEAQKKARDVVESGGASAGAMAGLAALALAVAGALAYAFTRSRKA